MAKSIYVDKAIRPDEPLLDAALGKGKPLWDEILRHAAETYEDFSCEWKHYGAAWGWSLVLKTKAKTLCYLVPAEGCFQTAVIFNDKGRALTAGIDVPERVRQGIEASKDNPQNIPYDFETRDESDVEIAMKLIAVRAKT